MEINRDIEFRGKDLLGKWRYGDLVQEIWKSALNTNQKAYMIKKGKIATTVLEETIGQYTGLKDENGKKIFEGDIIEFSYDLFVGNFDTFIAKGKVVFEEGAFYVKCFENERGTKDETYLLYSINIDTIEVIGNIYDNSELLEVEDE